MKPRSQLLNEVPRKSMVILWGIVLIAVFFMMLDLLILSPHQQNTTLTSQTQNKQQELELLQKGGAQPKSAISSASKSSTPRMQESLRRVNDLITKSHLSSERVISELLAKLNEPQPDRASVESFSLIKQTKKDDFIEVQFKLRLSGSFEHILNYLTFLKSLPYLIRTDSFSLRPINPTQPNELDFISVNTLYLKKSQNLPQEINFVKSASPASFDQKPPASLFGSTRQAEKSATSTSSHQDKRLNAIIKSQSVAFALIDQGVFKVGDSLDDFIIIEINLSSVVLKRGDTTQILKLASYGNEVKSPVPLESSEKDEKKAEDHSTENQNKDELPIADTTSPPETEPMATEKDLSEPSETEPADTDSTSRNEIVLHEF